MTLRAAFVDTGRTWSDGFHRQPHPGYETRQNILALAGCDGQRRGFFQWRGSASRFVGNGFLDCRTSWLSAEPDDSESTRGARAASRASLRGRMAEELSALRRCDGWHSCRAGVL